jgi:hypothetical protein
MNYDMMTAEQKEKQLLQKVSRLPNELIDMIYSYVPFKVKTFLNKYSYIHYHHLLRPMILKGNMENYIRDMLRRDCDFVFHHLLNENFAKWIFEIKNYKYKNNIYTNYLYFIKDFCLIQESTKCRNILNDFFKIHDLCKNQHKKNTVRNIRWKT